MKSLLPWLLVMGALAALGWQLTVTQKQQLELAGLRAASAEAATLKTELEVARQAQTKTEVELDKLRNDNKELLRLRNEIVQLRQEKQDLGKQVQAAQTQAQSAQEQIQGLRQQADALKAGAAAQPTSGNFAAPPPMLVNPEVARRYGISMTPEQQTVNCVNFMRQIDGAKQQWAIETNPTPGSTMPMGELLNRLPNKQMPACPAGGAYSWAVIGAPVTCSAPGHAMK